MRASNGTVTSYTPRTAAQIQVDTGSTALTLTRHAVHVGTHRYGGNDAESMAHTYDIALPVIRRALATLVANGEVKTGIDPESGEVIYSKVEQAARDRFAS